MTTRQTLESGLPINIAGALDAPRAVIVLQEAFGVNDHIRDVTDRYGDEGFLAVSPELFHRDGSPEIAYTDFAAALTHMGNFTRETLEADLCATATWLNDQGFTAENIGVVGYCMGGTVASFANTLGIIGAAASYYGGGVVNPRFGLPSIVQMTAHFAGPWLGLYGGLDKGIPMTEIEALREALSSSPNDTDLIVYEDADHGFNCNDRTNVFNADAAADATERTYEFFREVLTER
ncbi:MAG: dienelactone hydrolase family protein [Acidobacteria bacterium]|nr:dienelactone hydrolase family protein [Acidobacteriota bacterium]